MRTCICKQCGGKFKEDDSNPNIHYSNPSDICGMCRCQTPKEDENDERKTNIETVVALKEKQCSNRFIIALDTEQQKNNLSLILHTAIDVMLKADSEFVQYEMPLGWQDVMSSEERTNSMTKMIDNILDRLAS